MKAFALLCFALFGLCYAQTNPAFCSARLSTSNIAANGNFESAESWTLENAEIVPTSESGGCDGSSLKVDSINGSPTVSQSITVVKETSAPFYLSAWIKGDDIADSSAALVVNVDGSACELTIPSGTFGWRQTGIVCQAGSNPESVSLGASFTSLFSGLLYVDNVNLCVIGAEGCVYEIFTNNLLLNGWAMIPTVGNVALQLTTHLGAPALSITSIPNKVQEMRFIHGGLDNHWTDMVFTVANAENPVIASLGPLKPKTYVIPTPSGWTEVHIPLQEEESLNMLLLASIPTNYYVTSVGLM